MPCFAWGSRQCFTAFSATLVTVHAAPSHVLYSSRTPTSHSHPQHLHFSSSLTMLELLYSFAAAVFQPFTTGSTACQLPCRSLKSGAHLRDFAEQEAPSDLLFVILCAKLPHHHLRIDAKSILYIPIQVPSHSTFFIHHFHLPAIAVQPSLHLTPLSSQGSPRRHFHRQRHERSLSRRSHAFHRAGGQLDIRAVHFVDGIPVCSAARHWLLDAHAAAGTSLAR